MKCKVKDNSTLLNHNTWNEESLTQHVDMNDKSNVSQMLWAEWKLYTETSDYSNEQSLTKVRLNDVNMYHVILHVNSNKQEVHWSADFDRQDDIWVVRVNYNNSATMKNLTEQDCYAVYREYYQLCETKGSKHVKIRYVKNRTNKEDTFCSEDKVIQFINISSSNAESPTKTPKPLIIDSIQAKTPKPLIADSNQVKPFTNMSEAGLFITILKCLITTLMIEDDSESSETITSTGPIFIS